MVGVIEMVFAGYVLKITDDDTSNPAMASIPSHSDVKTSGIFRVKFTMKIPYEFVVNGHSAGLYIGRDNPLQYDASRLLLFFGMSKSNPVNPDHYVLVLYDDAGNPTTKDTGVELDALAHDFQLDIDIDNKVVTVYVDGKQVLSNVPLQGTVAVGELVLTVGYGSGTGEYAYFDDIHVEYPLGLSIYIEDFEDRSTDISAWGDTNTTIEIVHSTTVAPTITPTTSPIAVTPDGSNRTFMTVVYDRKNSKYVHFYGCYVVSPPQTRKVESIDGITIDISQEKIVLTNGDVPVVIFVNGYFYLFVRNITDVTIDVYRSIDMESWEKIGVFKGDPDFEAVGAKYDPWGVVYDKRSGYFYLYYNNVDAHIGGRRVVKVARSKDLSSWEILGYAGFQDNRDKYCVYIYPSKNYWYALVMDREAGASNNGVVRIYRAKDALFNNPELIAIIDTNTWHGGIDSDTPSINWHCRYMYVARQNSSGNWNTVAISLDDLNSDLQSNGITLEDPDTDNYAVVGFTEEYEAPTPTPTPTYEAYMTSFINMMMFMLIIVMLIELIRLVKSR